MSESTELSHRGAWLVYLNGLEVPCTSVAVSYGIGTIPEASLTFPAHRLLQRLGTEDKLEVVVFYLDDLADPEAPEFRLLFEGELIGWSYNNSLNGRSMTFNAIADISIFSQLHFFFLNNVDAITSFAAKPGTSADGIPQAGAVYPFSLFKKGLLFTTPVDVQKPPPPSITRPYEILYNVVRGMVDTNIDPKLRAVPSVNFFSRWTRKRNFINRFAALPLFEDETPDTASSTGVFPIIAAAQATTAMQAMQDNLSATIGNAGTLWEVLQSVFGHVLFEVAMLPTAPCARVRLSDGTILGPGHVSATSPVKPTEPLRLINYFVKPQLYFGIAPTCNVMFPSMIENYAYSESYIAQPTRTYVNDQFFSGVLEQNAFTAGALTFGYPEEAGAVLKAKMGNALASANDAAKTAGKKAEVSPRTRNPSKSGKNMLVFPEEFYKGPVVHRMPVPPWFTYLVNKAGATTNNAAQQADPAKVEESRALSVLMASYVEWEHFRARYEKRGGAVNLAWNPYVVPGFPCVIFDQKTSGFHTVGYLNSVQQNLSQGMMVTAINYSMSRTIPEMLDLLRADLQNNPGRIFGSAPLEPVAGVRDIIQDFDKAEQFYNALFFLRQPMLGGKKASFDFREVLGYSRKDGKTDPIEVKMVTDTLTTVGGASVNVNPVIADQSTEPAGQTTANVFTSQSTRVHTTLVGNRDVVPLKTFEPVFDKYNTAMRYVARPICSLTDYVSFLHGGKPEAALLVSDETSTGERIKAQVVAGDDKFGNVKYYKRIKRLTQGPGDTPPPEVVGVSGSGVDSTAFEGTPSGVKNDSQTRADWDTALEAYRSEMYNRQGPQE